MRYYEYLSSAKVEMLYPQIGRSSRSAGGEIGVDLKVIKVSRKTDGAKALSVHDKLGAVEDWIYANEPVGTIDEPDVWIYGRTSLIATTMTFRNWPGESVLFAPAEAAPGSELLMGGSAQHLAGRRGYPDLELPAEVRWASARMELLNVLNQFATDLGLPASTSRGRSPLGEWSVLNWIPQLMRAEPSAMSYLVRDLYDLYDVNERPSWSPVLLGECEFLAKRLRTRTDQASSTATLATPLFVAVID